MKTTLNQLVKISGVSRYHLAKIIADLEIEPEIEVRKNIKVQVFSDIQKQQILELAVQKKTSKTESVEADLIPTSTVEHTHLLLQLKVAEVNLQHLTKENENLKKINDYLQKALTEQQQLSRSLGESIKTSDARLASVIQSFSQLPKELTEKQPEKKSFWLRLFG